MNLRLSEQALANIYPTGTGKKAAQIRKTFLDVLNREVKEGDVVPVADGEVAAAYVASGLMEPADAESVRAVAAILERQKGLHAAAAAKAKAEIDGDAEVPEDRRLHLERQYESEMGYCGSIDVAITRCLPKKAAEKPPKE